MFLTELSLRRPVFATVTILALVSLGLISYLHLNIDEYPPVEFPFVVVTVAYPGAAPEQVEAEVGRRLEEALGQVSGLKHIYTQAREGVCVVFAEFTLETKPDVAAQRVRDKVGAVRGEFPTGVEEPVIAQFDPMAYPIVSLALYGDRSPREMTALVRNLVRKRIETLPGVGKVEAHGLEEREIRILLDKDKLAAYGLTTREVVESLRRENLEAPAGKTRGGERELTLRTEGTVSRVEEIADLPVARRGGVQLYVRDLGTVVDGIKEKESLCRYQGRPAIGLDIVKQSGSNTVEVARRITRAVEELRKELPPGVRLEVVRDNSVYIRDAVHDVLRTIAEGSLLAVVMVFLFLRDWRSTLISATAIPTAVISSFFVMRLMGFTINFMTLLALSLSVGFLIDDAIVVIENIVRHLRSGKPPLAAAREATAEVGLAVTATTFTVVAVFLPVGLMSGIIGQFFKQFGLTVIFAVLVSLFVSFTLTPLLAARHLEAEEAPPRGPLGRALAAFNRGFNRLAELYSRFLPAVLARRWQALGLAVFLFVGSLALIPFLGATFIPTSDYGELTVVADFDAGLGLGAAGALAAGLEGLLREYPEVVDTYSVIRPARADIMVKLVDRSRRDRGITELAADMRRRLNTVPGARVSVNLQSGLNTQKTVQYRLLGEDLERLREYAEGAQRIMEGIPGAVDVESSHRPGKPEVRLVVRHDRAADLGVSTAQVAETLATLFQGVVVGQFSEGENRYDVRVLLTEAQRRHPEDLEGLYLASGRTPDEGGAVMVGLDQVTRRVFATAPSQIQRFDRQKEIVLSANLEGISLGEFNAAFFKRQAQELPLPPGYRIYAGGESEWMADMFATMGLALVTGILFIFFVLASLFESYLEPFAVLLALPMAVIGAVLALLVTGNDLSIMSMIGLVMLMGLVNKNAVLLVDFIKQERARGTERTEAIRRAGLIRLRPIMMTSLAMIFGMLPLALGLGPGAEGRAPMAHVVIGGLVTSTLLTLFVVPVLYTLLDDLRARAAAPVAAGRLRARRAG
ncbi:MAG: efflux RND transporter permease subunit [Desulfotomaculales bacterium]